MGVLLGRSPASMQVLVTWTGAVVPSGMSLRGPDMSLADMRLEAVSEETAGSDWSEPLAVGVSDGSGHYNRVTPPSGGPSYRLRTAACFARDIR
jgi:hypothetical protein